MITRLTDLFELSDLEKMIAEGYVVERNHPGIPDYRILNYTEKAAYTDTWNQVTLTCRGLIYNSFTNAVVARPFKKFFNLGQCPPYGEVPKSNYFQVTDKMDGSLGIIYRLPDGSVSVATRGSFSSDQAVHATELLRQKYPLFLPPPGVTFLVEIVYPENRIVLDYGELDDLVLLEVLQNSDGKPAHISYRSMWLGPTTAEYLGIKRIEQLPERDNKEGYVLYWPAQDKRIKVKHAEYVRLHRILTNINARNIWEILSTGGSLAEILERVPDEFYDWVLDVQKNLLTEFNNTKYRAIREFQEADRIVKAQVGFGAPQREWRKAFAEIVLPLKTRPYQFLLLDGKGIDDLIWKNIRPEAEKPFKVTV